MCHAALSVVYRTSLYRVCSYGEKHLGGFIEQALSMGLPVPSERERRGRRKEGWRSEEGEGENGMHRRERGRRGEKVEEKRCVRAWCVCDTGK
jgi:hypothetical protein